MSEDQPRTISTIDAISAKLGQAHELAKEACELMDEIGFTEVRHGAWALAQGALGLKMIVDESIK